MNNLFKKGFASLALASAMVSSIFADGNVSFKYDFDEKSNMLFVQVLNDDNAVCKKPVIAGAISCGPVFQVLSSNVLHGQSDKALLFVAKKPNSDDKIFFHLAAGKLTIEASKHNQMFALTAKRINSESLKASTFVVNKINSEEKIYLSVAGDRIAIRTTKNNKIHLIEAQDWVPVAHIKATNYFKGEEPYTKILQSGKGLPFSVIHAKLWAVATTTGGKVINQNTLTATNLLDANKYGKALASSVIYAKPSVVATATTVGTAANNTYIINANSDLDVNNSGKGLSFSVIHAKPSAVIFATTIITDAKKNNFIGSKNAKNINFVSLAAQTGALNLENLFKTNKYLINTNVAANMNIMNNNTENVKINADFNVAYFTYDNTVTFGSFAAIASDNGEFKIMTHYTLSA